MSFLAAALLMCMDTCEQAFWVLQRIMCSLDARELFVVDLSGLRRTLHQLAMLVEVRLPALHNHLTSEGTPVALLCAPWYEFGVYVVVVFNCSHVNLFCFLQVSYVLLLFLAHLNCISGPRYEQKRPPEATTPLYLYTLVLA